MVASRGVFKGNPICERKIKEKLNKKQKYRQNYSTKT